MPVLSTPAAHTVHVLTPLTSTGLKHWQTFAALFPSLSAEMQSELWTVAHAPNNNLPDFPSIAQIEDFWRALHSAWTLSKRYPQAFSAAPIVRDMVPKLQDPAFVKAMDKSCNVYGPLNRHLVHSQQLVFDDAGEWGLWVDKLHKYQCIGVQPRLNVLDARKWSAEEIVEAVKLVKDLTLWDLWEAVLDVNVEVLVGSLAAQAAAQAAAQKAIAEVEEREGCVRVALMWDDEVWRFLEAK